MNDKRNALLFSLLLLSISFTLLSIFIDHHPVPILDHKISLFVQHYHSDWLDKVMLGISFFGELPYSLLMVIIVAGIFYINKFRRESYFILSILLSGLFILAVKNIIDRPRPTQFYVRLVEINRFQSFPSGHVLSYVLFFGFMIVLMKELKTIPQITRNIITYLSAFYIITIAFSRIYLGAHWFTDTLGGFILGVFCLLLLSYFYLRKKV